MEQRRATGVAVDRGGCPGGQRSRRKIKNRKRSTSCSSRYQTTCGAAAGDDICWLTVGGGEGGSDVEAGCGTACCLCGAAAGSSQSLSVRTAQLVAQGIKVVSGCQTSLVLSKVLAGIPVLRESLRTPESFPDFSL